MGGPILTSLPSRDSLRGEVIEQHRGAASLDGHVGDDIRKLRARHDIAWFDSTSLSARCIQRVGRYSAGGMRKGRSPSFAPGREARLASAGDA